MSASFWRDFVDLAIVTDNELNRTGAKFANGATPEGRAVDALKRYIAVPNRMILFYSSEDETVGSYILNHWAALDRLSENICDIYPSLVQLEGDEDAYSTIGELPNIPGAASITVFELPVMLVWSDYAYVKIPMGSFVKDQASLRVLFRHVIGALRKIGRAIAQGDSDTLTRAVQVAQSEVRPQDRPMMIYVDWRTDMSTNNTAGPGSVIVSGGSTGDIALHQKWSNNDVHLPALAVELATLRQELKAQSTTADHDVAIGQIAAAEAAAKNGDQPGVIAALKSTGKWVLGAAEKVGLGLATQAIKVAIGF